MPRARMDPATFRKALRAYSQETERKLRDANARRGEPATRPEANAFFRNVLRREGRRFSRAADLGANAGTFAREVLAPFCDALLLVDFSEAALSRARRRLLGFPRASFLRSDLADGRTWRTLRSAGPFDLVALCEVVQHMLGAPLRRRVFARAASLLTEGGLLLFSNYRAKPDEPEEGFFESSKYAHLLYYRRAAPEAVEREARATGLTVRARRDTDKVTAWVFSRSTPSGRQGR